MDPYLVEWFAGTPESVFEGWSLSTTPVLIVIVCASAIVPPSPPQKSVHLSRELGDDCCRIWYSNSLFGNHNLPLGRGVGF